MNSDNLRILNALKAIADKLGADDKSNVSKNEVGKIAEELERIAMIKDLKPEPSGGGGGGFLKVGMDAETHTLDKTWQEIYDALAEGWYVSMNVTDEVSVNQTIIFDAVDDTQDSGFYLIDIGSAGGSIIQFSTDSADGYPVFESQG